MKKVIRDVDETRGIVQVTISDERWYFKPSADENLNPIYKPVPSVTWICGSYPKGVPFYKWLADKGWDESQAIKEAAGNKGSKIHQAIDAILKGDQDIRIDSKFINHKTEQPEELTLEECDAILAFLAWYKETKPEVICWEYTIYSDKHNYAGTIDLVCRINGKLFIVDFKTGQNVWPEYELQVSAYGKAILNGEHAITQIGYVETIGLAILQIGYRGNKAGYKFKEVDMQFDLFLAAQKIWEKEHGNEIPSKRDYPIVLFKATKVAEVKATDVTPASFPVNATRTPEVIDMPTHVLVPDSIADVAKTVAPEGITVIPTPEARPMVSADDFKFSTIREPLQENSAVKTAEITITQDGSKSV